MLEHALQYAGRGWHVFPLAPQAKTPLTKRGFKDASTDRRKIEAWWRRWPSANVGIATGQASRLFVLDVDPGKDGVATLRALVDTHALLPPTLMVATGSGGRHLYYLLPEREPIKSSARDGLDVRCDGGYVVAPPSIHPNGTAYAWQPGQLALAPEWLLAWAGGRGKPREVAPRAQAIWPTRPSWLPTVSEGHRVAERAAIREPTDWGEVERALDMIPASVGHDAWVAVGMALHATGDDDALTLWEEWSATCTEKFKANECERRWASFKPGERGIGTLFLEAKKYGYSEGYHEPRESGVNHTNGAHALPPHFSASPEKQIRFPDLSEDGKVKVSCANARAALRKLGIECRHDVFHGKMLVGGHPIAQWAGELSDHAVLMLRVLIRREYGFDPGKDHAFDAAMQECLQHPFDPVVEWLDALAWDGVPRLAGWLARYLGAEPSGLTAEIGRLALVAAVRRARRPGCKFDQIIVFEGPEGRGKSSAIEIMAGEDNFSDQSILTLDDRGQQEAVRGVWLYEIADMAGHARSENERIKAFASRTRDRARPAYGRVRVDEPRRCIFFATTNDESYLRSLTGNRRFWPVRTGSIDLGALARDREQLWAEAAVVEARGESIGLDPRLWGDVTALQASRQEEDPWEGALARIKMEAVPAHDGRGMEMRVSTHDVLDLWLKVPPAQQSNSMAKRVAFIMRRLGWDGPKPLRVGGEITRGYDRPVIPATPATT